MFPSSLAVSSMHDIILAVPGVFHVGVDLQVHRQPLHPLLQRKVRGQALDRHGDQGRLLERVPVDADCVVRLVLDPCDPAVVGDVVGLRVKDALLARRLPLVPESPSVHLGQDKYS